MRPPGSLPCFRTRHLSILVLQQNIAKSYLSATLVAAPERVVQPATLPRTVSHKDRLKISVDALDAVQVNVYEFVRL